MKYFGISLMVLLLSSVSLNGLSSRPALLASFGAEVNQTASTSARHFPKAPAKESSVSSACLDRGGPLITISGEFSSPYRNTKLAPNGRIDARYAKWKDAGLVPLRIGGGPNVCVSGGEIVGSFALSTSWDAMHDTYAVMIRGGRNYLLSDIRIHNYGDGIYIGAEDNNGFVIRGAYLSQIRDDAFQNDHGNPGVVEDCLVDGAYVGFSDQKYTAATADSVWEIRNTLVRLQDYEQTYVIGKAGHGWFWKWDAGGINLSLHGNIFYADTPSIHGGHKLYPEKVVSCKKADGSPDNIIVWGGTGPYPRPEELQTGCFTLTTDKRVWTDAVANWKLRHNR
jgi:hypothetical protein